jgi:hypothetical protein
LKPAAVASAVGARSGGGFNKGLFNYKKEERLNRLNFLNRKRQILTVNRQNRAVNRQKGLALLSVMCQCPVC